MAVVDTNVARVYARRDGLDLPINKKQLQQHAERYVDHDHPIAYNNALMELGALVCTARIPDCAACPWQGECESRHQQDRLALTSNPLKVASVKKTYGVTLSAAQLKHRNKPCVPIVLALIHDEQGSYLVTKRPAQGVPEAGKWELPGGKREAGEKDRDALAREVQEELGVELLSARPFLRWDHEHDDVILQFHCYRCRLMQPEQAQHLASEALQWVSPAAWLQLDFPSPNQPLREKFADYHRISMPAVNA